MYLLQSGNRDLSISAYTIIPNPASHTPNLSSFSIMAPSTRNPTHGQKVDLGADAPTTTEGPGKVAAGSLAAESNAFKQANDLSSEQGSSQGKEDFGAASRSHHESGSARHAASAHSSNDNHDHSKNNKDNNNNSHKGLGSSGSRNKQGQDSEQRGGHENEGGANRSRGYGGEAQSHIDPAPTYVNNVLGTNRDPHEGPHGKNIKEDDSIATEDKRKNASFAEFGTKADPGRLAEQNFAMRATQGEITDSSAPRQSKIAEGNTPWEVLGSTNKE